MWERDDSQERFGEIAYRCPTRCLHISYHEDQLGEERQCLDVSWYHCENGLILNDLANTGIWLPATGWQRTWRELQPGQWDINQRHDFYAGHGYDYDGGWVERNEDNELLLCQTITAKDSKSDPLYVDVGRNIRYIPIPNNLEPVLLQDLYRIGVQCGEPVKPIMVPPTNPLSLQRRLFDDRQVTDG